MTLPLTIVSRVQRGGSGAGAWIARITGPHSKHGINRVWCGYRRRRGSLSGKRVDFFINEPGIYELHMVGDFGRDSGLVSSQARDPAGCWSGFIRVDATGSYKVLGDARLAHSEVLKSVRLSRECTGVLAELGEPAPAIQS